jgi:hypothetical protein
MQLNKESLILGFGEFFPNDHWNFLIATFQVKDLKLIQIKIIILYFIGSLIYKQKFSTGKLKALKNPSE